MLARFLYSVDQLEKWFPPYSDEIIDDMQRQKIINNVCEAMKLLGVGFVVE